MTLRRWHKKCSERQLTSLENAITSPTRFHRLRSFNNILPIPSLDCEALNLYRSWWKAQLYYFPIFLHVSSIFSITQSTSYWVIEQKKSEIVKEKLSVRSWKTFIRHAIKRVYFTVFLFASSRQRRNLWFCSCWNTKRCEIVFSARFFERKKELFTLFRHFASAR